MLARKEEVFYAGEAWLEDGILVLNHNSGTFKPNSDYLPDLALYFQKTFGVKKVHFSTLIPAPRPFIDYTLWIAQLKTFVRAKRSDFSEGVVKLFSRNEYQGKTINMRLPGSLEDDIVFEVGENVGSGFYGSVYNVIFQKISSAAKKQYSLLLDQKLLTEGMVVKFPNDIPLLRKLPSVDIFERSIIKEFNELGPLKEIAQEFGLQDINIIFQGKAFNKTFLVKKLLKAHSIGELSKMQKVLTLAQEKSLENDIYALAVTVKKKLNLDLDIKAENLAWDPSKKRFVMYELSVRNSGGFLYPEGFKGYLDYFTNRFNTLSLQRKPSSLLANSIKMCSDNSLGIPSEFKKEYESKLAGYKFNFKSRSIDLNDVDLSGCFKVSDISYQGSHQQINFLLFSDKSSLEFIEFAIHKDVSTKEASFGFTINNNGVIANSIEDGVVEK